MSIPHSPGTTAMKNMDIFFSICQARIRGHLPSERSMFENFFDQVEIADQLGFGTAWIAESHLSCEVQKTGSAPVIPNFQGEIGLNTDIFLLAQRIFARTKSIEVGSAIRNILVNGGPIAHAEAARSFLSLHGLDSREERKINLGFAAGRFQFSSAPFGIVPRKKWEEAAWSTVKRKIFLEATEVFLRLVRGDIFSSHDLTPQTVTANDLGSRPEDWQRIKALALEENETILLKGQESGRLRAKEESIVLHPRWTFERLGIIPKEAPLHLLSLLIGSHDPEAQILANQILPCGVFNLSITPGSEIEATHSRMQQAFNGGRGGWSRSHMPRTTLIFLDATPGLSPEKQRAKAKEHADEALRAYWDALEGTLDEARISRAVDNALVGNPSDIAEQIASRFHPDDRLMLWFDFFNHDSSQVIRSMESFRHDVVPLLNDHRA